MRWAPTVSSWSPPARRMPSGRVASSTGRATPYKVFTPFSKAWRAHGWPAPAPTPRELPLGSPATSPRRPPRSRAALAAPDLPGLPPAGEKAALRAVARVPRRAAWRLRRRPRPARPRRHLAAVALPEVRRDAPAHAARRPRRARARHGAAHLRDRAGLARVLRRRAVAPAAQPPGTTCGPSSRGCATTSPRTRIDAWQARAHRLPDRRRRHAPAAGARAGCTTGCG